MASFIQPSFSKGELAPSLYGRVDTQAYQVGVRTGLNCFVHATGGLSNRAGTTFLAPVKDHSYAPSFIEFQFKTTDTYLLEFGDGYMRVLRNDVLLTETAKNITGITKANPAVVTSNSHGFSNGDDVYIDGVVGMTEVNGRWFRVANVAANTFELTDQVDGTNINSSAYTTYTSGGTASRVYEIDTPYAIEDVPEIKYVQSADVMTLTHNLYPVYELSRTGHTNWTLAEAEFQPSQAAPTAMTVTVGSAGAATFKYKVTAIAAETAEESLAGLNNATLTITGATQANPCVLTITSHGLATGDEIYVASVVGMTELNDRRFIVDYINANTFSLRDVDSSSYTAYSSGGTARRTFVVASSSATTTNNTIAWTAASGAQKYAVYRQSNGLYGLIGETEDTSFVDSNLAVDLDLSPPASRNPFDGPGNYPGTASYYEQRRVFGGSVNAPDTSEYSQTGRQNNLSVSSPSQADDAITATLSARQVNEIRHYVPGNDLIVLTSGSEWRVNSGADSAFSAATLKQKPQSAWGSSHLRPQIFGNVILYVPEDRYRVRSLGYSLQSDAYTGSDMTILSNHIFERYGIVDWAASRSPEPIVYLVREDGWVACMTFQPEQEVNGWTRWNTKGKFETVGVLPANPNEDDREDRVYFVVKRRVNGKTVRYIERLHRRRFDDVRDAYFVDCGLSLDNPVTVTGVTSADPVVVTAPTHGFNNGDYVDFSDIVWEPTYDEFDTEGQPDQLNLKRYVVRNKATNTFELEDLEGNAVDGTAFEGYVEGGYVRKAVQTITGLNHLEGWEVSVLADGSVVEGLTVSGGSITLPQRASRVHVGLKYTSDIETLNIESPGQGTLQGKLKRVVGVTVRLVKSRGLWHGPKFDNLTEAKQRSSEDYDEPTQLLTGDLELTTPAEWNKNGRICFRQRDPLPMTILAVVPDVHLGESDSRMDDA
jgi:hypothetical protein